MAGVDQVCDVHGRLPVRRPAGESRHVFPLTGNAHRESATQRRSVPPMIGASHTKHSVAPLPLAEVHNVHHETDVLVVGYGCAGAAAALEAHAGGAQVTVLERTSGPGGSSALSGGEIYLGGGTRLQEECGFSDTAEDMAAFLIAALGPDANEEKIRVYSDGSREHYDWLVDHGVAFKASVWDRDRPVWVPPTDDGLMWMGEATWPYKSLATPAPRGHRVQSEGFGGKVLMSSLIADVENRGAADVHTDTGAQRLVVDGDRVVGVVARRFGEDFVYLARKGVILTTGGFVDNDDMLDQHAPQLKGVGKNSDGGDDGRGIVIAQSVGAAVRRMSSGQIGIAFTPGYMARGIVVNQFGQRFINEDVYPGLVGQAALFRQGMNVWTVLDEQAFDDVPAEEGGGHPPTFAAETLAELEGEMGLPEGSLQATVEEYNRHAVQGQDPYFHKSERWVRPLTAPFAAISIRPTAPSYELGPVESGGASVFTLGGLVTDNDGRVQSLDGIAIAGLYAAGRAASELHGRGYISGTSLGSGTFFGRRAGRAAAGSPRAELIGTVN